MFHFSKLIVLSVCSLFILSAHAQQEVKLKKKDRRRDVELVTTEGTIILRLYEETPLHRDNFLKLVKSRYYDSILFHRVIRQFMIQAGDPNSKIAPARQPLGNGGPSYTIPAEFHPHLFHKKGALAAARNNNPEKASSGSQFYIVHGRTFSDASLDSIQTVRLNGRQLPAAHREYYKTIGGTPQLDQNYTVFGEVVSGLDVIDHIASLPTSPRDQADRDRPFNDVRIIRVRLIKRKR